MCCFQGRRQFTPVPAQQRQPNRWQWAVWAADQALVACGTCCRTRAPRTAHTAREALKPTHTYTHTVSTGCGGAVPSPRAGSAPAHTQSHTSSHKQAICHERGVCEWSVDQAGRWPRDAAAAGWQPALPPVRAGAGGARTAGTSSGTGYCALPAPAVGLARPSSSSSSSSSAIGVCGEREMGAGASQEKGCSNRGSHHRGGHPERSEQGLIVDDLPCYFCVPVE